MNQPADQRSYYDVLQIERDADAGSVRKAYRRLMQQAGNHPDRGGDAATAALINKAYAVLSDGEKRSDYDARLDVLLHVTRGFAVGPDNEPNTRILDPARVCMFCEQPHAYGKTSDIDASCDQCGSPLSAADNLRIEPSGQRAMARLGRQLDLTFFTHWHQAAGFSAITEDVSLHGLRMVTRREILPGQRIRLVSNVVEAVGKVTNCVPRHGLIRSETVAGVAFLTLRLARSVGGFLSQRV
jgi:curved DNA-binding protein CbpA